MGNNGVLHCTLALKLTLKSMEDKVLYFPKLHMTAHNLNNLHKQPFSLSVKREIKKKTPLSAESRKGRVNQCL